MKYKHLQQKLLYREHFLTLFVVSLECANTMLQWL